MCIYEGLRSDTFRKIEKFDIWVCDLGEMKEGGNLAKKRPCVIVQNINHKLPNMAVICPIRTEHKYEVQRDNLENIVEYYKNLGRIYIPIELEQDNFRFIDMTEIRSVTSSNMKYYIGSIGNATLCQRIDQTLCEMFGLSTYIDKQPTTIKNETNDSSNKSLTYQTEVGKKIQECNSNSSKTADTNRLEDFCIRVNKKAISTKYAASMLGMLEKDFVIYLQNYNKTNKLEKDMEVLKEDKKNQISTVKTSIPTGFSLYYKQYKANKMTVKQIADKLGRTTSTVYNYIKRYEEMKD